MHVPQRLIASSSDHAPLGSSVTRASGKRFAIAVTASISCSPRSTPPLSLKSREAIMVVGGFREPHDGLRRHRFLVAQLNHSGLPVSPLT